MRINRFLATAGIASRRKAELLVLQGKVTINGEVIRDLSQKVDEGKDRIEVNGKPVRSLINPISNRVLAFYKPAGYLTSHGDKHHTKTIFTLLPQEFSLYKFSGRLDLPSRGLLFLSDSGDIIQNLTHPSQELEKEYEVTLSRKMEAGTFARDFLLGIRDKGETLRAKSLSPMQGESKLFRIVLVEGRKRQIRRMFSKYNGHVEDLKRIRIGKCRLDDLKLKEGEWCWVDLNQI